MIRRQRRLGVEMASGALFLMGGSADAFAQEPSCIVAEHEGLTDEETERSRVVVCYELARRGSSVYRIMLERRADGLVVTVWHVRPDGEWRAYRRQASSIDDLGPAAVAIADDIAAAAPPGAAPPESAPLPPAARRSAPSSTLVLDVGASGGVRLASLFGIGMVGGEVAAMLGGRNGNAGFYLRPAYAAGETHFKRSQSSIEFSVGALAVIGRLRLGGDVGGIWQKISSADQSPDRASLGLGLHALVSFDVVRVEGDGIFVAARGGVASFDAPLLDGSVSAGARF
jgi:hypothetical protein